MGAGYEILIVLGCANAFGLHFSLPVCHVNPYGTCI